MRTPVYFSDKCRNFSLKCCSVLHGDNLGINGNIIFFSTKELNINQTCMYKLDLLFSEQVICSQVKIMMFNCSALLSRQLVGQPIEHNEMEVNHLGLKFIS